MKKFKIFFDYEKEERWINAMCAQGWHLKKISLFVFTFERNEPGLYVYRNILMYHLGDKDYSEFLTKLGIEFVCVYGNIVYLRKRADAGMFEFDSGNQMRLQNINQVYWPLVIFFFMNLLVGFTNASFIKGARDEFLGWVNIIVAIVISIPLYFVYKIRKNLKEKNIRHE